MSKTIVSAVITSSGKAKATGNDYTMCFATVLVEFEPIASVNRNVSGAGLVPVELSVSRDFAAELHAWFQKHYKGIPLTLDLYTRMDSQGKNSIVGMAA